MTNNFATLDAETDPFRRGRVPHPFAWGLLSDAGYDCWWGVAREDEVAEAIEALPEGTIVYAHNGGRFDFHYLLPFINPAKPLLLIRGRIASMFIGEIELRDSWLLIPEALAKTGLKGEIDYSYMEADRRQAHRPAIEHYLEQDCVALWDLIAAFYAEHGRCLTLPAGAIKAWTRLTEQRKPRLSERIDETLRPFYFGGRCEARELGELTGRWNVYDINSAYPSAMMEPHLAGKPLWTLDLPEDPARWRNCFVKFTGTSDRALPVRDQAGGVQFPAKARGTYYATGHELAAGIELGLVKIDTVDLVAEFPSVMHFAPFIQHYWEQRARQKAEGDHLGQLVSKRTMNSVYGKLGQDARKRHRHRVADAKSAADLEAQGWTIEGTLGPWILLSTPNTASSRFGFLHVGAAASITGAVRAKLLRAIESSTRFVYCDTDSIIARRMPKELLGGELGEWEHEAVLPEGIAIAGKKLYAGRTDDKRWKMASKGVRLAPEDVLAAARGESVVWEPDAPTFQVTGNVRWQHRTVTRSN